jgi:subtilisin
MARSRCSKLAFVSALLVGLVVPVTAGADPTSGPRAASPAVVGADHPDAVAGSWIVTLDAGSPAPGVAAGLARANGGRAGLVYTAALNGFQFLGSAAAATNLARNPAVIRVEADRTLSIASDSYPLGLRRIDADTAHGSSGAGANGTGAVVAVLDTGIETNHGDLTANVVRNGGAVVGTSCIAGEGFLDDGNGHGTHVAGTVAAAVNGIGVVGVAPAAKVVPVKVLSSSGSGSWASVICGIDWVTDNADKHGIGVANMSLSGSGTAGANCAASSLRTAICASVAAGVTYVVAASNDGRDASGYVPAAYPEVITVSAYEDRDGTTADIGCSGRGPFQQCDERLATFSNYGRAIDVMAPGVRIYSTDRNNTYSTKSGTSMAAPHVAGVAALVLAAKPTLTPAQVRTRLQATGECPGGASMPETGGSSCPSGAWKGDPDGIAEPMVNAAAAVGAVPDDGDDQTGDGSDGDSGTGGDDSGGDNTDGDNTDGDPAPPISLSVTGYKVKGFQHADLTWGDTAPVDVYRDGTRVASNVAGGSLTDNIGAKGGGSYTYRVCLAGGTDTCSAEVTVSF